MVFFAYIGFDAVSTAAQETRNPQRDLPIGILGSLAVCTVLYIAVSLILTGVVHYTKLDVPHPIAVGIAATGIRWLTLRGRDRRHRRPDLRDAGHAAGPAAHLLLAWRWTACSPRWPPRSTRKYGTPYITTIITGIVCAIAGGMLPIDILAELTSIGTLFAFVLVSLGVMILRIKRPDIPAPVQGARRHLPRPAAGGAHLGLA